MEKISVSNIIEFRRKSPNSQVTFINNLRKVKPEKKSDEGGNYWVHSLSTISSIFESEENELLGEKIEILQGKRDAADARISKGMFQRNIKILLDYEKFNFLKFKPKFQLKYLAKPKAISIISIKGIPVQVLPNHVFTFEDNGIKKIGAIWFVAKLDGYTNDELAIFTDALYRYLKLNYSKDFEISTNFCVSVDVSSQNSLQYIKVFNKEVSSPLNSTLESINKVMK